MSVFALRCLLVAAAILLFALLDLLLRLRDPFNGAMIIAVLVLVTLSMRKG